jgi:integrase
MDTPKVDLKVSFYLRKDKNSISGNELCPVTGRISIGNDIAEFSCKLKAAPALWDVRSGRLNGKSHHAMEINAKIDRINVAANTAYRELVSVKGTATAAEVKNACLGISSGQETLLGVFREHNEEYKRRIGINIAFNTWRNYNASLMHLKRFIGKKYHVSDIHFRQLNFSFIDDYDYYLRIGCKMKQGTMVHKIYSLRKMVGIAINKGIIGNDPFAGYSCEQPKSEPKYLPAGEVEKLMRTPMQSSALEFTRDMFVFSIFTGLAYADLRNLTRHQIFKDDDGSIWLNINRQKNGNSSFVPLLEIPLQLIEKYRGTAADDRVFPMKSNIIMNVQLKAIAKRCDIERRLTFHLARHSFLSFLLKTSELQSIFLRQVTIWKRATFCLSPHFA